MTRSLLTLLLITVLAYTGIWNAGFVWDDVPLIVQNKAFEDGLTWSMFIGDLWADSGAGQVASGYYRPLVLLSFALDRAVFGMSPGGYHLHSLLWNHTHIEQFEHSHKVREEQLIHVTALVPCGLRHLFIKFALPQE